MSSPEKTPLQQLFTPVQFLKGVGPQRAEMLDRLGLHTARDVLFFFPRSYQDLTESGKSTSCRRASCKACRGAVDDIELRGTSAGGCVLGVLVRCQTGHLRGLWFNQPFMRDRFFFGQRVLLAGKPRATAWPGK